MVRLSDVIESFIKELFDKSEHSELQIQRNELASYFSCAPSQINYVLTTRFTTDKGYYIESKRGGGGCILIRKVEFDEHQSLADIINDKIGHNITCDTATKIIENLLEANIITIKEADIMKVTINDRTLCSVENKNKLRADILKSMMLLVLS
jgi:transcriptional regulator of stress and heat shock response